MECGQCFLYQPFVVLAVDQFVVGQGGGLLERQNRIATFIEKLAHCL